MSIVLGILTFVLVLVSLFLVLVVLMQKSKDGGIGSALGGGAAEAAFGAETNNVLSRSTIFASILFFVLAFVLYLGRVYEHSNRPGSAGSLPTIAAPAVPAPAPATAPAIGVAPDAAPGLTVPGAVTPALAPEAAPAPTAPAPAAK